MGAVRPSGEGIGLNILIANAALTALSWLVGAVTVAACVSYHRRTCERVGLVMLIGASGALAFRIAGDLVGFLSRYWIVQNTRPDGLARALEQQYLILSAFGVLGLAFGLMFAVSLLKVLRRAARRVTAADVGQIAAVEGGPVEPA